MSAPNIRVKKVAASLCSLSLGLGATSALGLAPDLFIASTACGTLGILVAVNALADRHFSQKSASFIHAFHAGATDLLAFLTQLLLYPSFPFFRKKVAPNNPDLRPILLIHGYLHNASAWIYLMPRLKKARFRSIYTLDLYPPFESIDLYAERVKKKILQIQQETGQKGVILIGHSMGGLVASRAALDLKNPDVTHVITLGAPFKGARGPIVKYLGFGKNARQMEPGSLFTETLLKDLSDAFEQNREIKFFHAASKNDLLVPLNSALALGENHKLQESKYKLKTFYDLGHASLPLSPSVGDEILAWLTN